jgi:hypothetical protein
MSPLHRSCLVTAAAIGAAAALTTGCGSADHASGTTGTAQTLATHLADRATADSCTLLSAAEAAPYVGALTTPPFRANDNGVADAGGDACTYHGTGARQLVVVRTGEGSAAAGKIVSEVPNIVGGGLEKAAAGNLAAATHRVMADVSNGPWDKANWIPGGTLFVTKGDAGANIDVSGSGGKEDDAIAIGSLSRIRRAPAT